MTVVRAMFVLHIFGVCMLRQFIPTRFLLATCLLLLLFFLQACTEDANRIYLYGQFYYGMPIKEVLNETQSTECSDNFNHLCRRNLVPFFKESWYQRFIFSKDRLVGVQLTHTDPKKVRGLIDGWLDSGYRYIPVAIKSAGRELDLYAEIRISGKEGARKAVQEFSRETARDLHNDYIYLDLDRRENLLNKMYSYQMILNSGPRDLIGIEESVDDKYISITFIAPVAEWQDKGSPKP